MKRILILCLITCLPACSSSDDQERLSSRAYKGHESNADMNSFASVYPATIGTRLDDCQTCHKGDTFSYDKGGGNIASVFKNACDYCHLIQHPDADFIEAQPTGYTQTLNPYGTDYSEAGRSRQAIRDIADSDSDSDSYSNKDEIADLKYPGDPDSMPGQQVAPSVIMTMADLRALTAYDQFLLCNSSKQEYDDYASYEGVKLKDLLEALAVDPNDPDIEGITVIAPDGYMKDFSMDQVLNPFPASLYYAGLDNATLGAECGFVNYPDTLPAGLVDGEEIPGEQWLSLAYLRDGLPMDPSNLDISSGRINGEGPFRIIVPQSIAGSPDRGSKYSPSDCNDGFDYDDSKDHNAGAMVRGVTGIRINPLPAGTEDFDNRNGGWAFIDSESVIIYGHGINP
jgi:hypothetical protein